MALLKLPCALSFISFVFISVTFIGATTAANNKTAINAKRELVSVVPIPRARVGEREELRCKLPPGHDQAYWTKDQQVLNFDELPNIKVKRKKRKKRRVIEILTIDPVKRGDGGLYMCKVKDRDVRAWNVGICKYDPACGIPEDEDVTVCDHPTFDKCRSFPGVPLDVNAKPFIHDGTLVIQIGWREPTTGYSDLWGYEVTISSHIHAGYHECYQINRKNLTYHTFFEHLRYRADYVLSVQSLPANNRKSSKNIKEVVVHVDQCSFTEWKNTKLCCSIINTTVVYENNALHASWNSQCMNETLNRFRLTWTNMVIPLKCAGSTIVTGWENYTIPLSEECRKYNYSVRVYGLVGNESTIRSVRKIVQIHPTIVVQTVYHKPGSNLSSSSVIAIVAGGIGGLAMAVCFMFFIYKKYLSTVYIQLPEVTDTPNNGPDVPLVNETGPLRRVFLVHTHCCEKCKWVIHSLGMVFKSTGLLNVRADVWNELEIQCNVLKWYLDEINEADCVVVIASDEMNAMDRQDCDASRIPWQQNVIQGQLSKHPETSKFKPAYFSYNGRIDDIPIYLRSRQTYALPEQLLRLLYNVLNIERMQANRYRPITVLGGRGHPAFETELRHLQEAVNDAANEHDNRNNNLNEAAQHAVET